MNPCPCGYHGDDKRVCRCTPQQIAKYGGRLSGPLRDRLDLIVEVESVPISALTQGPPGETSAAVRARVLAARARQTSRAMRARVNAQLTGTELKKAAALDRPHAACWNDRRSVSTSRRARFHRVIRVARTIADLARADAVTSEHLGGGLAIPLHRKDCMMRSDVLTWPYSYGHNDHMRTIAAGKFKDVCLQTLDEVATQRRPVVITKRGRPVAKLVPIASGGPRPIAGREHRARKGRSVRHA